VVWGVLGRGGLQGREMTQALYAHINNKTIKKIKNKKTKIDVITSQNSQDFWIPGHKREA
jgi:hypothetical protein